MSDLDRERGNMWLALDKERSILGSKIRAEESKIKEIHDMDEAYRNIMDVVELKTRLSHIGALMSLVECQWRSLEKKKEDDIISQLRKKWNV